MFVLGPYALVMLPVGRWQLRCVSVVHVVVRQVTIHCQCQLRAAYIEGKKGQVLHLSHIALPGHTGKSLLLSCCLFVYC